MKRLIYAMAACLGLMAGAIQAETDEKPVPREPYVAPVPEYGRWIVTLKYDEGDVQAQTQEQAAPPVDGAAAPPKASAIPDGFPTSIETTKAGELRSVALTFVKGAPKQFNCRGDWILSSTLHGPQLMVVSPSHFPYMFYTTGFVLLDGVTVNASTFQEVGTYNDATAFHYKSGETDVWIDVATMLPLAVKKGGIEAVYQFPPSAKRPVVKLPPDQAALLQRGVEADKYVRALR